MTTSRKGTAEGSRSDDIAAIAAVLRDTPFHRWSQLRDLGEEARHEAFDAATAKVMTAWTKDEQRTQVRQALTVAATEIILAMPDWATGEPVLVEHLRCACAALQAAGELTPGLNARSVA